MIVMMKGKKRKQLTTGATLKGENKSACFTAEFYSFALRNESGNSASHSLSLLPRLSTEAKQTT